MKRARILFSPLEHLSDKNLLLAGCIGTIVGLGLSVAFGVAQDGIIDLHLADLPWDKHLAMVFGNIALLTLGLFLTGKMINPGTRLIDLLYVTMVARIPLYIGIPLIGNKAMVDVSKKIVDQLSRPAEIEFSAVEMVWLLSISLLTLLFIIWFFVLLVNGFRIAVHARKWYHFLAFALVILLLEMISKILYMKLLS